MYAVSAAQLRSRWTITSTTAHRAGSTNSSTKEAKLSSVKQGLPPALEAEYRFLKQQVDFWMEAWTKRDASPSAGSRYWYAKDDLKKFVNNRRKEGYRI